MKFDQLKAIFSSYKNAPAEIREKFALSDDQASALMFKLKEMGLASEALVVSTCNRTELYYIQEGEQDISKSLIKLLLLEKGILEVESHVSYFDSIDQHHSAVNRLFNISAGLESQVLGDLQITGQVKHAYQLAADANMAGPFLHRLMHTIFFTNKRIVQETSFRDGAASVSYAAVELVETVTEHIGQPNILVLGTGKIGADVCRTLVDKKFNTITILNRTVSKAQNLAEELALAWGFGKSKRSHCKSRRHYRKRGWRTSFSDQSFDSRNWHPKSQVFYRLIYPTQY
jgi:glutamyl-tRNA reductase